jgi:hypothetical protein
VFILAAVTAWVYGPGPLMEISMYLEKAELGDLYCRLVCLFMREATYSISFQPMTCSLITI